MKNENLLSLTFISLLHAKSDLGKNWPAKQFLVGCVIIKKKVKVP